MKPPVVDGPEDSVFSAYREFLTVIGGSPRAARSREGCLSKARGTRRGTRGAQGIQGGLTWWFIWLQLEKWWNMGEFETTPNLLSFWGLSNESDEIQAMINMINDFREHS